VWKAGCNALEGIFGRKKNESPIQKTQKKAGALLFFFSLEKNEETTLRQFPGSQDHFCTLCRRRRRRVTLLAAGEFSSL